MATAPYTLGGEGLEAHIMDFLNSDSIEQGHFVERNTSIPSIPFSSFSIPLDLIQGEKEDNAYAALLKDHTANSTATAAPYLSRTSRTESSSSHSRKENAQSTKRKFLVDIDSQNGVDSEDEFAHICRRLVSPRRNTSSKTHRATHVHNLSEKRRRNRINEKMKALQLLIPNSQKTDKASILDEAIEYIEQLQLQVQMLSSANKMNPSHICSADAIPCFQIPQMCMNMNLGFMRMGINMTHSHFHSHCNNGLITVPQGVQGLKILPCANAGNKE